MDASIAPDDGFDVSDPTDWLGTPLAALQPVEASLRCHVCKDFYNSPMLTSCSHTFCSLCVRRALAVDGRCPLCRAADQESKLRGNWAVREAVDAFARSRPALLRFARMPVRQVVVERLVSPKRKPVEEVEVNGAGPETKRLRMSTRASKARAAEATAAMMRAEADIFSDSHDGPYYEPDDGLVACPICLRRMKDWQVDKHIDSSCPGEPQPESQPWSTPRSNNPQNSTSFGSISIAPANQAPERLAPLNYFTIKDVALRKKMAELGLSTYGHRTLLEKRHKEWVTIWNANCDSAHPKTRSELLRDLDVWERTVGNPAPSRSAAVGAQIKDKDFDGAAWTAKHDTSFKDLIASARRTRVQAKVKADDEATSDVEQSSQNGERSASGVPTPPHLEAPRPCVAPVVDLTESALNPDADVQPQPSIPGSERIPLDVQEAVITGDDGRWLHQPESAGHTYPGPFDNETRP